MHGMTLGYTRGDGLGVERSDVKVAGSIRLFCILESWFIDIRRRGLELYECLLVWPLFSYFVELALHLLSPSLDRPHLKIHEFLIKKIINRSVIWTCIMSPLESTSCFIPSTSSWSFFFFVLVHSSHLSHLISYLPIITILTVDRHPLDLEVLILFLRLFHSKLKTDLSRKGINPSHYRPSL